jgi:hypothetical protein
MHWVIIPVQWHWRSIEFTPTRFLFSFYSGLKPREKKGGGLIIQCERYEKLKLKIIKMHKC